MSITIFHKARWHIEICCFMQPAVQKPKTGTYYCRPPQKITQDVDDHKIQLKVSKYCYLRSWQQWCLAFQQRRNWLIIMNYQISCKSTFSPLNDQLINYLFQQFKVNSTSKWFDSRIVYRTVKNKVMLEGVPGSFSSITKSKTVYPFLARRLTPAPWLNRYLTMSLLLEGGVGGGEIKKGEERTDDNDNIHFCMYITFSNDFFIIPHQIFQVLSIQFEDPPSHSIINSSVLPMIGGLH